MEYVKSDVGDRLRAFWKPNGKAVDKNNEKQLKQLMKKKGVSTAPGGITMFLRSRHGEG